MNRTSSTLVPVVVGLMLAACSEQSDDTSAVDAIDGAASDVVASDPTASAPLPRTPSPAGARVFFISPSDGDSVSNPVRVEFGIEGMAVVKAGEDHPQSGHHHLIVNAALPQMSLPIPASDQYIHFGDASTSTELSLAPGEHTLQLLLGDYLHIPHEPPVTSEVITITVE